MHHLTHAAALSETQATEAILNACRANHARNNTANVSFLEIINSNEHSVVMRDTNGFVIAKAIVDQYDV